MSISAVLSPLLWICVFLCYIYTFEGLALLIALLVFFLSFAYPYKTREKAIVIPNIKSYFRCKYIANVLSYVAIILVTLWLLQLPAFSELNDQLLSAEELRDWRVVTAFCIWQLQSAYSNYKKVQDRTDLEIVDIYKSETVKTSKSQ